jgi:hypothetical protein
MSENAKGNGRTGEVEAALSLSDEELDEAVWHHVLHRISAKSARFDEQAAAVKGLSPGLQRVLVTQTLDMEVKNGGFHQYFWNPSGRFAAEALEGLREFGATRHASLLEEAMAVYDRERSRQQQHKAKGTLAACSDSAQESDLGALDMRYYQLEEEEDLPALRAAYIRARPQGFELDQREPCCTDWSSCPLLKQAGGSSR